MTTSSPRPRFDAANECVWWGERRADLPANAFRLLSYLVERPNRIVSKEELLDAIWPGTHVIDAVLSVAVSQIRQALEDDPRNPRFVETVHRRGYRFIGSFTPAVDAVDDAPAVPAAPVLARTPEEPTPRATPVFGRDDALAVLDRSLARAAQGDRQVVFLTGEPGIGKTTLVDHFVARVTSSGGRAALAARGQCVDTFGAGEPCMPLLEALEELCRSASDGVAVLRTYAPTWLLQLPGLLAADEADELRRSLANSTGERMMRELQRALERLAAETTVVLVLEDLHWSDATTISMLASLVTRRESARLLLVGTWRPADAIAQQHPIAGLRRELAAKRLATEIALDGLGVEAIVAWLDARFAPNRFDGALAAHLHAQTAGNPLFLVNAVEHMQQQGLLHEGERGWEWTAVSSDVVPDTTREMIEARLVRLSDDEQALLESASVIGRTFAAQTLAAASGMDVVEVEQACARLARAGQFLAELPASRWPDGSLSAQYEFRHALYQQVCFQRVTAARRRSIDLAVARRLEAGHAADPLEVALPLAVHYERGGDADRAVTWRYAAASLALRRYSHGAAVEHLRHALELLFTLPEGPARQSRELQIRSMMIPALLWTVDPAEIEATVQRVSELAEREPMSDVLLRAFMALSIFFFHVGRIEDGTRLASRFLERAGSDEKAERLRGVASGLLGCYQSLVGELEQAEANLVAAGGLPGMLDGTAIDFSIVGASFLAVVRCLRGDPRGGLAMAREVFRRAVAGGQAQTIVYTANNATRIAMPLGDHTIVEEVTRGVERFVSSWSGRIELGDGWLRAVRGDPAGIEQFGEGRRMQLRNIRGLLPMYDVTEADLLVRFSRFDEAGAVLSQAFALMEKTGERWCEPEALRVRAMAEVGAARALAGARRKAETRALVEATQSAETLLTRALELAARHGSRLWELRAAVSLVRIRRGADPATELEEIGAPPWAWFDDGIEAPDVVAARNLLA